MSSGERGRLNPCMWEPDPQEVGGGGAPDRRKMRLSQTQEEWGGGCKDFTPVCTLEVVLFCMQSVSVGEFCSGDWRVTMLGWRANSWLVAEQKSRKIPSAAGLAPPTVPTARNQVFMEPPE